MSNIQNKIFNYEVHFTISPECEIIKLGNSNEIRFEIGKIGKKNYLFRFHVLVTNAGKEESRLIALQKALQLCNLMSVKHRFFIKPILTGISKIKKDGTREVLVEKPSSWANVKELNFDMKDKEIIKLLHDATMRKIYHHIAKGIESYYRSDHAESIRQFYQVVEHPRTKFPTLKKNIDH